MNKMKSILVLSLVFVELPAWALLSAQSPAPHKEKTALADTAKQRAEKLKKIDQHAEFIPLADIPEDLLESLFSDKKGGAKTASVLQDQYKAAREEADHRWGNLVAGRGSLDLTLGSFRRMLKVELDLCAKKVDVVAVLEAQLQRTRDVETVNQSRFDAGRISIQDLEQSRFYRIRAEIRLERAKAGQSVSDGDQ
jgi:hypothetical protein